MVPKKVILVAVLAVFVIVYAVTSLENNSRMQDVFVSVNKNPYVTEYSLPQDSAPNGLVVAQNGIVWVAAKNATLYSINPSNGVVSSHQIRSDVIPYENARVNATMVWTMLEYDGKIWFSPYGGEALWGFDPIKNDYYTIKPESGTPFQMKSHDGKIWYTTLRGNTVGVLGKTENGTYKISEFHTGNDTGPAGLFLFGNSLWIANVKSQNVVQYAISQKGDAVQNISVLRKIPQDNSSLFSSPTDLHVNNNTVWLTEHGTSFLASYDIGNGIVTRYPTSQNTFHTTTLPFWIRSTNQSNILWFNEHEGNKIGRLDVSNKTLTEYEIPSLPNDGYLTYPLNIAQDQHDEKILWFSEWNTDKIGMINGHASLPFEINLNATHVVVDKNRNAVIEMTIPASKNPETLVLNASSTITPTAELGNLTVKFLPNMVNTSHDNVISILVTNGGVAPGDYTLGLSASDGLVTSTKFVGLTVYDK
ncbi:exported hypothetical protein [Nitrosotalea sinensis]|uniref:Streptogramin lyase n=1 Tax=Nitrosotalea sinensis TaxID=1499975 RepID=A0A2H1EHH1_9ARCH|nr:hypothetical protein [Candidatus Nitrosotalea sinensis]SHO45976.1 exported hypothetical protein [Candidatus Nitrosotalea sinensis]